MRAGVPTTASASATKATSIRICEGGDDNDNNGGDDGGR
jgi:hypothetical protein